MLELANCLSIRAPGGREKKKKEKKKERKKAKREAKAASALPSPPKKKGKRERGSLEEPIKSLSSVRFF